MKNKNKWLWNVEFDYGDVGFFLEVLEDNKGINKRFLDMLKYELLGEWC